MKLMCGGCGSCGYSSIGSAMYASNSESGGADYVPSTSLGYQAQSSNYSSMSSSYSMRDSYQ
ncbi:hypothetical protein HY636_05890 [Candidatus Woesearchaeota archaeon]|nr:hypothetical protein [Candidatus Woesearchaeota archaeon]